METTYAPSQFHRIIEVTPLDDMLAVSEAVRRYGIAKQTVYDLIRREIVGWDKPTLRGEARVNHADLRAYLHAIGRLPCESSRS